MTDDQAAATSPGRAGSEIGPGRRPAVVDRARITELAELGEECVRSVITGFGEGAVDLVRQVAASLAAAPPDLQRARGAAHQLRGSSMNLGLPAVEQLCAQLEQAFREGDIETASRLAPALPDRVREAVAALQEFVRP